MNSIRLRLNVLFLAVTTATLAAFGGYGQLLLSRELEQQFADLQQETMARLTTSTARPLWDLDLETVRAILTAEMRPEEMRSMEVHSSDGSVFVGLLRDASGAVVPITRPDLLDGIRREAEILRQVRPGATGSAEAFGRVVVHFSRARIDKLLRANLWRRGLEILVVDALLVAALSVSLRLVFRPLATLRDALFDLAGHENEEAEELPETKGDEFGQVIHAFNLTQRKLKSVIARRQQAEESARAAAASTEQALVDLKTAQASLLQSEKLASLGGLVAGVAHEVNTPIGITLTSASVLQEKTLKLHKTMTEGAIRKAEVVSYFESVEEITQVLLANSQRAAQLIQNFKQVAADQTSEVRREYELGEYIQEVISSLNPKLRRAGIKVSVSCPEKILLDGYPGAMAQVLANLTMNAAMHAFPEGNGGQIEVAAKRQEDRVEMTFRDDGKGIAAEHLGRIFDPFFTTRRGSGGTGLGLNIVHNIMNKQFGGTINVSSEAGKGTCFTLSFPRVSPQLAQQ